MPGFGFAQAVPLWEFLYSPPSSSLTPIPQPIAQGDPLLGAEQRRAPSPIELKPLPPPADWGLKRATRATGLEDISPVGLCLV